MISPSIHRPSLRHVLSFALVAVTFHTTLIAGAEASDPLASVAEKIASGARPVLYGTGPTASEEDDTAEAVTGAGAAAVTVAGAASAPAVSSELQELPHMPVEVWEQIFAFCDGNTRHSLAAVHPFFAGCYNMLRTQSAARRTVYALPHQIFAHPLGKTHTLALPYLPDTAEGLTRLFAVWPSELQVLDLTKRTALSLEKLLLLFQSLRAQERVPPTVRLNARTLARPEMPLSLSADALNGYTDVMWGCILACLPAGTNVELRNAGGGPNRQTLIAQTLTAQRCPLGLLHMSWMADVGPAHLDALSANALPPEDALPAEGAGAPPPLRALELHSIEWAPGINLATLPWAHLHSVSLGRRVSLAGSYHVLNALQVEAFAGEGDVLYWSEVVANLSPACLAGLRELSVTNQRFIVSPQYPILDLFDATPNLTHLTLNLGALNADAMPRLVAALGQMVQLSHLTLAYRRSGAFDQPTCDSLADMLVHHPALQTLDCALPPQFFQTLSPALLHALLPRFTALHFPNHDRAGVADLDAAALGEALNGCSALERLEFDRPLPRLWELAASVAHMPKLKAFIVGEHARSIGGPGEEPAENWTPVLQALVDVHPPLTTLVLNSDTLSSEALRILARVVERGQLTTLELTCRNPVVVEEGEASSSIFVQALGSLSHINTLRLERILRPADARTLVTVCANWSRLEKLALRLLPGFTREQVDTLLGTLHTHAPLLEEVQMSGLAEVATPELRATWAPVWQPRGGLFTVL